MPKHRLRAKPKARPVKPPPRRLVVARDQVAPKHRKLWDSVVLILCGLS